MTTIARIFQGSVLVSFLAATAGAATEASPPPAPDTGLPALAEGLTSFGGAVAGDSLYVYGGHIGRAHSHTNENLSNHFRRLDLRTPSRGWQEIGENVRGLQGLALVPWNDGVCRVGGLDARNAPGEDDDLISVDTVACWDPATGAWTELPPLPEPRSSHDAAVHGDHLYVAGGWHLGGKGVEADWHDDLLVLDLSADEPAWTSVPQPFQRRALAVATAGGKVFVLGGITPDGTSARVDVYEIETGTWSEGPDVPGDDSPFAAFGASAFGIGDDVYLSGMGGSILVLPSADGAEWKKMGELEQARFFHRLLPDRDRILFVAGASREGHLASIETVPFSSLAEVPLVVESDEPEGPEFRWASFRNGDGHAPSTDLPREWSDDFGIAWRRPVPGFGQSAPVVWDRQVFVTSTEGNPKSTLILSSFDLVTGDVLWRRRFEASQLLESTDMVSRAAPTPAVDEDRVYAFWESGDVVALDHDGETLWQVSLTDDYGEFAGNHGVASSPVVTGDALVLQVTHEGPSYMIALTKAQGLVSWFTERPDGVAWTSPVVVRDGETTLVLTSAAGRVEAFDSADGRVVWERTGIEKNNVPSATVADGRVIVASSDPAHNRSFDLAGEPQWTLEGVSSGFGSPVVVGDRVLFANRSGVVTAVDAESGSELWQHRLPEHPWATPVVAGDDVWYFTKEGATVVLRPGAEGAEVLAENPLAVDGTIYGVAAVRGAFLVRTGTELVRIGLPPAPEPAPAAEEPAEGSDDPPARTAR